MKPSTAISVAGVSLFLLGAFLVRDRFLQNQAQGQGVAREGDGSVKEDKRTLSTTGTGSVRVKPDSARVYFRVETIAQDIKGARTENNQKVKKIMDALGALKIPNLRMKSDNVAVSQIFDRHHDGQLPRLLG